MSNTFTVGATVRLARDLPKSTGTATILTLQDDNDETACVLWDPIAPKPLQTVIAASSKPKRRLKRPFLVAPLLQSKDDNDEEERETTVKISSLKQPLDFETNPGEILDDWSEVPKWKDRGDQLLKLGDASKACSYYEMALKLSSILQVGATVIVKAGGHAKLADIDCLEDDDDDVIEVSMTDSGEEKVVKEAEVLLCILQNDEDEHLQERTLLNLARCLLQLAELSKQEDTSSERRPKYLRSAVLAATLALTIAEHHAENTTTITTNYINSLTNYARTALVLRGQAQAGLGKWQNAISDTKRVLQVDPQHKEATKQLKNLQNQQQKQKDVDKKLVKSMCKWVQTATNEDPVSERGKATPEETSDLDNPTATKTAHVLSSQRKPEATISAKMILIYVALPLAIAFILQKCIAS